MLPIKHTNLETTQDVKDTLEWKIQEIEKKGLPIDSGLADYIAFSIDNLENQLLQLKLIKNEVADREKAIKSQIEAIKVDGAAFLLGNGLEKLEGVICSSVTVTQGKESEIIPTTETKFVMSITQTELEELLIGLGKAEYKEVITEKITNEIPAKIRVNKRKVLIGQIEDENI